MFTSFKKRSGLLIVSALGLGLGGCGVTPDYVFPLGRSAPLDARFLADPSASAEASLKTAKSGELLFTQDFSSADILVLENTVEPTTDVSMQVSKRTVDLSAGLRFYTAINLGLKNSVVACSFERPMFVVPRLNPGNTGTAKVCFHLDPLADTDGLDAVDTGEVSKTSSSFFVVNENFVLNPNESGPYRSLMSWEPDLFTYQTNEPARFRPATDEERAEFGSSEIGLRYKAENEKGELSVVYISANQPLEISAEPVTFSASDSFPKIVTIRGAEIELLALTDGVLAYRVLSGFTPDKAFILDLPE
ncbi:MAG: hypothetical protein CMK09_05630 [Ponticaulis sp.]|nr:hypothetical protein [Ponticaulis sp.]|tara:strand:+ start:32129 stop:33043 length:915 start_codon:yes stop_codon:yes gene_type:complete